MQINGKIYCNKDTIAAFDDNNKSIERYTKIANSKFKTLIESTNWAPIMDENDPQLATDIFIKLLESIMNKCRTTVKLTNKILKKQTLDH